MNKTGIRDKLYRGDVIEIRQLYATKKYKMKELAEKFGVSTTTISAIVRGETHKETPGPVSRNNWHNNGNVENFWWNK